jgi:ribosomal protein S10
MFGRINISNNYFLAKVVRCNSSIDSRNSAQVQVAPALRKNRPKIEFKIPLQPIYTTVPSDFNVFVKEVNKAFGGQWAPRVAFEEIFQFYLDRTPKEKYKVAELRKVKSSDFMTTYMLDAIEDGGMEFIRSLGEEWQPLTQVLKGMTLNERRSFCCKILYQRMKEMRLQELAESVYKPKPFQRETPPLTPHQQKKSNEKAFFDIHLPQNVRDAYMAPKKLKAQYNIIVAQLQIRGYYLPPVDFMADFCARAAYYFGLPCTGPVPLPRRIERWATIKAPFVMKKTFENFERRTHSRLVTIKDGHPDVVEMWLSYCYQNMYHGTGMKAHLFTNDYIGVGKTMSEDIKQLIETERWSIDGYNALSDDAASLQNTIDEEIRRIEGELSTRDDTSRATRILQQRVQQLLELEQQASMDAELSLQSSDRKALSEPMKEEDDYSNSAAQAARRIAQTQKSAEIMQSLVKKLPDLEVQDLEKEVEWDKQQDEALRKHLLHVGMYAQQKGVAPLTREEYFVYVPFVLLPTYKGIHRDVFDQLGERNLLRSSTGYLANWDRLSERERYDLVVKYRKSNEQHASFQGDKMGTSRLSDILDKRRPERKANVLPELHDGDGKVPADSAGESKSGSLMKNIEELEIGIKVDDTVAMESESVVGSSRVEQNAKDGQTDVKNTESSSVGANVTVHEDKKTGVEASNDENTNTQSKTKE